LITAGPGRGRGGGNFSRKRKHPYNHNDDDDDNDSGCVITSVNGMSQTFSSSQSWNSMSRNYSTSHESQYNPPLSFASSGYGSQPSSSRFTGGPR